LIIWLIFFLFLQTKPSFPLCLPVPEFIDHVFAKTSLKRSFLMTKNERFRLVFVKTGSINSGTGPSWTFATSDFVSAVSEGYLDYCWILKSLSGPKIYKFLTLCGNQLIKVWWHYVTQPTHYRLSHADPFSANLSVYHSCLCLCSFCFLGKIFQQLNLE
jgi:hypothetical protein